MRERVGKCDARKVIDREFVAFLILPRSVGGIGRARVTFFTLPRSGRVGRFTIIALGISQTFRTGPDGEEKTENCRTHNEKQHPL